MKKILLILILTVTIWQIANANTSEKLNQLQQQIQQLKSLLSQDQNKQTQFNTSLQQTEITASNLSSRLQKTQQDLTQQQKLLAVLNQQQLQYQNQLDAQQTTLASELRSIYMLGHQQYLKVLLNQEDPNQLNRLLMYYHYINHHRLMLIEQFSQTLQELNQTQQQIEQQTSHLLVLQNQQQQQQAELEKSRLNRQQLLQTLTTEMANKQQKLNVLIANKQALEQVVNRLEKARITMNFNSSFKPKHGKLPWPTQGKIIEHFGTQIEQSQLKLGGVLIKATAGQKVYAVMPGQVVFANWMAGYGLLLIIHHGNGYMTIYGRNQNLYKKLGDVVNAGDLIATVGNTGGYSSAALYFGIRQNGMPINPEKLCG